VIIGYFYRGRVRNDAHMCLNNIRTRKCIIKTCSLLFRFYFSFLCNEFYFIIVIY